MDDVIRNDIRKLLKQFGVGADDAIMKHLENLPGDFPLDVQVTLEDLTDYGEERPEEPLKFVIHGQVRRQ